MSVDETNGAPSAAERARREARRWKWWFVTALVVLALSTAWSLARARELEQRIDRVSGQLEWVQTVQAVAETSVEGLSTCNDALMRCVEVAVSAHPVAELKHVPPPTGVGGEPPTREAP